MDTNRKAAPARSRVFASIGPLRDTKLGDDFFTPMHLRYNVTLDHEIDGELLARAWDRTKRVYPVIDSVLELEHGSPEFYISLKPEEHFRYQLDDGWIVRPESGENNPVKTKVPVAPGTALTGGRMACLSYYGRSLSLNAFHTLTDGVGMMMILRTLLYSYLALYTGHEDETPPVELRENRGTDAYYRSFTHADLAAADYTPTPMYSLPPDCRGFNDRDMVNDGQHIAGGTIGIPAAEFMKYCRENGGNPSAAICYLLGRAAYLLNPEEKESIIFGLTISARKILGMEDMITNLVSAAVSYATKDDILNRPAPEVIRRIRGEIDSQRTRDYYLSVARLLSCYSLTPLFPARTVTYMGPIQLGDNASHVVDFDMETNGESNLYLAQLNDRFILKLMYGQATEKYLNALIRVFGDIGIDARIIRPAHFIPLDSPVPVL